LKAIEHAKENKANLRLRSTMHDHIGTYVVEENVPTLSLTYEHGYARYFLEEPKEAVACPALTRQGSGWYASKQDEEQVREFLESKSIEFEKHDDYVRICWYNQQRTAVEVTFYVQVSKLEDTMNFLHYNLI
jgi:aspartate kinase